ncbi:GD18487 [Drosophila simulans]|uniref:GD18487 n=1 Tax=Drosophila simulans TaxID=7240 RepID=B4NVM4_DROSI|nr:GD18487 [Drosophila simulans]
MIAEFLHRHKCSDVCTTTRDPDADLSSDDAVRVTNFHRVLITLSKLSQCRKVQQLHPDLIGFNLQLSPTERSHSDEAIYKDLHST